MQDGITSEMKSTILVTSSKILLSSRTTLSQRFNADTRRSIACKTLQIIKSDRVPRDPAGRIVLTTKSRGTSRKVDPWKRDIGPRDSAGRIPFIPPNRSRYIGARLTSAQISGPVTLGTGDLAGFPRASEDHDAAGKLFYINRGLTGGSPLSAVASGGKKRKTIRARDPPRKCEPQFAPPARAGVCRYVQLHRLKLCVLFRRGKKLRPRVCVLCSDFSTKDSEPCFGLFLLIYD